MSQWEYLTLTINPTKITPKHDINDYGADGWELVSIYALSPHEIVYTFKQPMRPKPEPDAEQKQAA